MNFKTIKIGFSRPELSIPAGVPITSFFDEVRQEMVYTTDYTFAGRREVARLYMFNVVYCDPSEFLELEIALMEQNRIEDWSI